MSSGFLRYIGIFIFFVLVSVSAIPQSKDTSVKGAENDLKLLQDRIRLEKQKRDQAKLQEKSVLRQLDSINQRINVRNKELNILENQLKKNETNTQRLQRELEVTKAKLNLYQAYLAGRVRTIYISNRVSPYQQLLSATNYADEVRHSRYQRIFAYADAKSALNTRTQSNQISRQKFDLSEMMRYQRIQEDELSQSKKQYLNQQKEKSTILVKVKTDQVTHDRTIKELEASAKKLEKLLEDLRRTQSTFADPGYMGESFAQLRGKLVWPVSSGTILYGPGTHKILSGMDYLSHGIGIKASQGTDVMAVHDGVVRFAGWFGDGLGNTIVIDHGQSYMTLYMHLADIAVKKDQVVQRKQKIGTVGDTGSYEGTQLEFQIRKGTSTLDPQDWLVKR